MGRESGRWFDERLGFGDAVVRVVRLRWLILVEGLLCAI